MDKFLQHKTNNIKFDQIVNLGIKVIDTNIEYKGHIYRGITKILKEKYYKDRIYLKGASTKKLGTITHEQIYHYIECKGKCSCIHKRKSKKIKDAIRLLKDAKFTPIKAEYPIVSEKLHLATRLDVLCEDINKNLIVISVKTGFQKSWINNTFLTIPNTLPIEITPATIDNLQSCLELAILTHDYHINLNQNYFILYLGKNSKLIRPFSWTIDATYQKHLYESLVPTKIT